jgi:hypothetical protein
MRRLRRADEPRAASDLARIEDGPPPAQDMESARQRAYKVRRPHSNPFQPRRRPQQIYLGMPSFHQVRDKHWKKRHARSKQKQHRFRRSSRRVASRPRGGRTFQAPRRKKHPGPNAPEDALSRPDGSPPGSVNGAAATGLSHARRSAHAINGDHRGDDQQPRPRQRRLSRRHDRDDLGGVPDGMATPHAPSTGANAEISMKRFSNDLGDLDHLRTSGVPPRQPAHPVVARYARACHRYAGDVARLRVFFKASEDRSHTEIPQSAHTTRYDSSAEPVRCSCCCSLLAPIIKLLVTLQSKTVLQGSQL